MSTFQILTKNNTFLAGLDWRVLPAGDESNAKQAAAILEREKASYGVIVNNSIEASLGFVTNTPKVKNSASVQFANNIDEPSVFLTKLDDSLYWIVIAQPRLPLFEKVGTFEDLESMNARKEQFLRHEDTLYEHIVSNIVLSDLEEEHWFLTSEFKQTENQKNISDVLGGPVASSTKIKKLRGLSTWHIVVFMILAAAITLTSIGYYGYQWYKDQQELKAARENAKPKGMSAEQLETLTDVRIAEAVQNALKNDTQKALPADSIDQCIQFEKEITSMVGGWDVKKIECQGTQATLFFSRNKDALGTSQRLFDGMKEKGYEGHIHWMNEKATRVVMLDRLNKQPGAKNKQALPFWKNENDWLNQDVVRILTLLQKIQRVSDIKLTWNVVNPQAVALKYKNPLSKMRPNEPEYKDVPPRLSYKKGSIKLKGSYVDHLHELPLWSSWTFMSIDKITINHVNHTTTWQLEASYVTQ